MAYLASILALLALFAVFYLAFRGRDTGPRPQFHPQRDLSPPGDKPDAWADHRTGRHDDADGDDADGD